MRPANGKETAIRLKPDSGNAFATIDEARQALEDAINKLVAD